MILITGGINSGKRQSAEKLAKRQQAITHRPVYYISTAVIPDSIRSNIYKPKYVDLPDWQGYEGHQLLADHINACSQKNYSVIILDDISSLLGRLLKEYRLNNGSALTHQQMEDRAVAEMEKIIMACRCCDNQVIFITHEPGWGIGSGYEPANTSYLRTLGKVNQMLAYEVNKAYLCVSGIEIQIKG